MKKVTKTPNLDTSIFLKEAINAAKGAGKIILDIYQQDFAIENKSDNSPVTLADKKADVFIRNYLHKKFPMHGFLTEESEDDLSRLENDFVWIVDPLDGTMDFVARDNQFATNIALSYKHDLLVGVVFIPITGECYYATKNNGAYYLKDGKVTKIHVSNKTENLICLTSMFYFSSKELEAINRHRDKIKKIERFGSSIKACRIAHGLADISIRMTDKTKEWDTAAPQIIVEEAGGLFLEPDGKRITYNKKDFHNHKGYIITNHKDNFLI